MKNDLSPFLGKWIAICDEKVVSSGENPKKVLGEAKKACPGHRPLLAMVPGKETMIF